MSAALQAESVTGVAAALELRGIVGGYGRLTVLRDVDLSVRSGTITALLGPNGAGKTTLLRVAAGLLRPREGSVSVAGVDVTRASTYARARAGMCLVPEGRGIFPNLTVRENLQLQVPRGSADSGYERGLEAFPALKDRLGDMAGTLSGGQQQMLAVARCYLSSPSVVLLDEVSMGLAPRIVDQIFMSLERLAKEGVSLLLVEQYVNRALEMADTVYVLNRGHITFAGSASDLDEETVVRGYLGAGAGPDDAEPSGGGGHQGGVSGETNDSHPI